MVNIRILSTCTSCYIEKPISQFGYIKDKNLLSVECQTCQMIDKELDLDTAKACKRCKNIRVPGAFVFTNNKNYISKVLATCVECRMKDRRLRLCPHANYISICKECEYVPRPKAKKGESVKKPRIRKPKQPKVDPVVEEVVEPVVEPVVESVIEQVVESTKPKAIINRKLKSKIK